MGFFDGRRKDEDSGEQLAVGMELPRVYYLLGPPEERIDNADGFTMVWVKTNLAGVFRGSIKKKVTRVVFKEKRVVSWTVEGDD